MNEERYIEVKSLVFNQKSLLKDLSEAIWNHPELGFEETFAHEYLTNVLQEQGFQVQRSYKLPTAFRAEFCTTSDPKERTIAILCEYDALPELGHACGHNLIAECGIGAAIAVKAMMELGKVDNSAKLVVIGTPAEEHGGGKIKLIELGGFEGVDMAMMTHPAPANYAHSTQYQCTSNILVEFKGETSHAANSPWIARNALDAVVSCYNNISVLRQQTKPDWRIHLNITDGGFALNCIPDKASMKIGMKANTAADLRTLKESVMRCVDSAALTTQCHVTTDGISAYKNVISNFELAKTYRKYAERSGAKFLDDDPNQTVMTFGATDMGDVTHIMPGIQPEFFIGKEYQCHTSEFAEISASDEAQDYTLNAAVAMACTALDAMTDHLLYRNSFEEFKAVKSKLKDS